MDLGEKVAIIVREQKKHTEVLERLEEFAGRLAALESYDVVREGTITGILEKIAALEAANPTIEERMATRERDEWQAKAEAAWRNVELFRKAVNRPSPQYTVVDAIVATKANRAAAEALAFLRDEYSPFGSRACPACVYEAGVFVRYCKLHQEVARLQAASETLEQLRRGQAQEIDGKWQRLVYPPNAYTHVVAERDALAAEVAELKSERDEWRQVHTTPNITAWHQAADTLERLKGGELTTIGPYRLVDEHSTYMKLLDDRDALAAKVAELQPIADEVARYGGVELVVSNLRSRAERITALEREKADLEQRLTEQEEQTDLHSDQREELLVAIAGKPLHALTQQHAISRIHELHREAEHGRWIEKHLQYAQKCANNTLEIWTLVLPWSPANGVYDTIAAAMKADERDSAQLREEIRESMNVISDPTDAAIAAEAEKGAGDAEAASGTNR